MYSPSELGLLRLRAQAELERRRRAVGRIDYSQPRDWFHADQLAAWGSAAREVAIVAGSRAGKTCLAPWLALREIQARGGNGGIIVSPTYALMERALLPTCLDAWRGMGTYSESKRRFDFSSSQCASMGVERAWAWFGYGENPDSLESFEAQWGAVLDECGQRAFKRQSQEALRRRCAIHQSRLFYLTTPYEWNWLKTDVVDKARERDDIDVFNFSSLSNPVFPRDEWDRQKSLLPQWRFDMMYRGLFTRPAGQVFEVFDPDIHVVPDCAIPSQWVRVQGVDFGEANTAAVWLARLPGGDEANARFVVAATYHGGHKGISDHVAAWRRHGDVHASFGGAPSEDDWRAGFAGEGWPIVRPPTRDREYGLQAIHAMLASRRLFVLASCEGLIRELFEMSYEVGADGEVNPLRIEDERVYHLIAALRYAVVGIVGGASFVGCTQVDREDESDWPDAIRDRWGRIGGGVRVTDGLVRLSDALGVVR